MLLLYSTTYFCIVGDENCQRHYYRINFYKAYCIRVNRLQTSAVVEAIEKSVTVYT